MRHGTTCGRRLDCLTHVTFKHSRPPILRWSARVQSPPARPHCARPPRQQSRRHRVGRTATTRRAPAARQQRTRTWPRGGTGLPAGPFRGTGAATRPRHIAHKRLRRGSGGLPNRTKRGTGALRRTARACGAGLRRETACVRRECRAAAAAGGSQQACGGRRAGAGHAEARVGCACSGRARMARTHSMCPSGGGSNRREMPNYRFRFVFSVPFANPRALFSEFCARGVLAAASCCSPSIAQRGFHARYAKC